jgi:predicted transcriptional regulator
MIKDRLERWLGNVLYKRVKASQAEILHNQIVKGAEKYSDPLPGKWTAKQLIRHGKEENIDQFVYYEALEIVVEQMESTITDLNARLFEATQRAENAEKKLADQYVIADRERRKWANFGR